MPSSSKITPFSDPRGNSKSNCRNNQDQYLPTHLAIYLAITQTVILSNAAKHLKKNKFHLRTTFRGSGCIWLELLRLVHPDGEEEEAWKSTYIKTEKIVVQSLQTVTALGWLFLVTCIFLSGGYTPEQKVHLQKQKYLHWLCRTAINPHHCLES